MKLRGLRYTAVVILALASCKGASKPGSPSGSGIAACDKYIDLVRKCGLREQSEETRKLMKANADKMENDLRGAGFGSAPDDDKDKAGMREICETSMRGENPVIGWCDLSAPPPTS